MCGHPLGRKRHEEMWVEDAIDDDWVAAYRVMVEDGQPLVAEVRLFPHAPLEGRGAGRWSERVADVPADGVPGRTLRELRLKVPRGTFAAFVRDIAKDPRFAAQVFKHSSLSLDAEVQGRRPGRKGRSDAFYLVWAVAYVQEMAKGSRHPIKDLAEHPPSPVKGYVSDGGQVSEATVRDLIHKARTRGLLSEPPRGQPGGHLTEKAKGILSQAGERRSRRP
jgi:hypothetical protein